MPIVISPNKLYAKKQDGSGYLPANVISGETTEEQCARIEAKGDEVIDNLQDFIDESQETIDTMIETAQTALDGIEGQRQTMIASIASVAGQGTDTALSQSGVAADAKAAGDEISNLKNDFDILENQMEGKISRREYEQALQTEQQARLAQDLELGQEIANEERRAKAEETRIEGLFVGDIEDTVTQWLEDHPETVVNVQPKSISVDKLVNNVLNFVTPEMYGAVGDGAADDADAIETASAVAPVYCGKKQYYIGRNITLVHGLIGGRFIVKNDSTIYADNGNNVQFIGCDFTNDALPTSGRGSWILAIRNSANPCVFQCTFHDAVSCVYVSRCQNPTISQCVYKNISQTALDEGGNGYGVLFVECVNAVVSHSRFINVARHSIYISHDATSTYNKNIKISENSFVWETGYVLGNASGFETTIMIRAALDVSIINNFFSNVYTICTINRQIIKVDGEDVFTGSKRVLIDGNCGTFQFLNRRDGIVFLSGSRTDEQDSAEDITIKNNIVECTNEYFVVADHYKNLRILNNRIKINTTDSFSYNLVHCKLKRCDILEDLEIIDNDIEFSSSGSLFMIYANDENATRLTLGNYIVCNNRVKNIYSLGRIPSGYSFNKFVIANNIFEFVGTRDYFSSPTIAEFYANGNIANQIHGIYVGTPTKVLHTDPIFNKYSAVNHNPSSDTLPGSINVLTDGSIYIKSLENWVPVQQAT